MLRSLIWSGETCYLGVNAFAQRMKEAIMATHDAIIAAQMSQTVQANKHCCLSTLKEDNSVYLSTKNLNLPKGQAQKLVPKYLGPFCISKVIMEGATYQLEPVRGAACMGYP